MPSRLQHLDQSSRNEKIAVSLLGRANDRASSEWAIIALFYSALHLVDAFLASHDIHPKNHTDRLKYVSMTVDLSLVFENYRELLNRSLDARYNCTPFREQHARQIYETAFVPLKHHLARLDSMRRSPEANS